MIEQLQRAVELDPDNISAKVALIGARARIDGAGVLLECLSDRETWNAAPEIVQDMAVNEVGLRLGSAYELSGAKKWRCENNDEPLAEKDCLECDGTGIDLDYIHERDSRPCHECNDEEKYYISHRLATFTHRATGIEFQLLPGSVRKDEPVRHRLQGNTLHVYNDTRETFQTIVYRGDDLVSSAVVGSLSTVILPLNYIRGSLDGLRVIRVSGSAINPFLIARWPVTVAQMFKMAHWITSGESSILPQTGISYRESVDSLAEYSMRLPAAEEWEYACRAGTTTKYYWGEQFDPSHVWYVGNSDTCGFCTDGGYTSFCMDDHLYYHSHSPRTHDDAGKYNAFGLVDMVGNVSECVTMPSGYPTFKVGSFSTVAQDQGAIHQYTPGEDHLHDLSDVGFRPALTIPGDR